jgi:hypothetical protein
MDFIPGYMQGLSKVFTTYPFDVVKINMQANKYQSTLQCFKDLIKTDRKAFFRGISYPLISFPIDRAISYKIYEDMNKLNFNPYQSAFCGGIISSFINVPMQYFTTNAIITKKEEYKGMFQLIKETLKNKNNFYKGYALDTSRALIGSSLFLGTYGNIKNKLPENNYSTMISSIGSITITWLITFPIDAIRVENQITKEKSIKNIIITRYNKRGITNFYNGLTPVLIRSIPSTIIGMLVYENTKNIIKKYIPLDLKPF